MEYPLLAFIAVIFGMAGLVKDGMVGAENPESSRLYFLAAIMFCMVRGALMHDWITVIVMLFSFIFVLVITRWAQKIN